MKYAKTLLDIAFIKSCKTEHILPTFAKVRLSNKNANSKLKQRIGRIIIHNKKFLYFTKNFLHVLKIIIQSSLLLFLFLFLRVRTFFCIMENVQTNKTILKIKSLCQYITGIKLQPITKKIQSD